MWVEFFVEEPSAKAALDLFLPLLLPPPHTFNVINMNSKPQLLLQLPDRLKGYANMMTHGGYDDLRVVVLVDRDEEDCTDLKEQLEAIAADKGLLTKTQATAQGKASFQLLNRVVCEELESWFFGDVAALQAAFSRLHPNHFTRQHLKEPDAIRGGTDRALLRTLQKAGYFPGPLLNNRWKYEAAAAIGPHLHPDRNTSPSFKAFVAGVRAF